MKTLNETANTLYEFFASPFFNIKEKLVTLVISYVRQVKNDAGVFEELPESKLIKDKRVSISDDFLIFPDFTRAPEMVVGSTEILYENIEIQGLSCRQYYTLVEGVRVDGQIAYPAYSFILSTNVIRLFPELQAIIVNCPDEATREALTTLAQQLVYDRIKDQVENYIEINNLA